MSALAGVAACRFERRRLIEHGALAGDEVQMRQQHVVAEAVAGIFGGVVGVPASQFSRLEGSRAVGDDLGGAGGGDVVEVDCRGGHGGVLVGAGALLLQ